MPSFEKDAKRRLEASFGAEAAALVAGISRLNDLRVLTRASADADAAQIEATRLAWRDEHEAAAQVLIDALREAPPSASGWKIPIDPHLAVSACGAVYAAVLTQLRQRSA